MNPPRVLNTRARDQAGQLSRLLAEAGFEPLEYPAIRVVAVWDAVELERVRGELRGAAFDWVVVPSQNAGVALRVELKSAHVVCGTATARGLGIRPDIALDRFSASAALEALRSHVTPGLSVLVPRAAEGRDELVDGLTSLGALVHAPVAYRTICVETSELGRPAALIRAGQIDAVTLCSPSSSASLLRVVSPGELSHGVTVCLGETTATAARAAGVAVDAVAAETNMASLVAAVRTALSSRKVLA